MSRSRAAEGAEGCLVQRSFVRGAVQVVRGARGVRDGSSVVVRMVEGEGEDEV